MSAIKTFVLKYTPDLLLKSLKKIHYYKKIKEVNDFSEEDFQLVKHFVSNDSLAIDIGANVGLFTKIMSKYAGKVISFEPIPETFQYLQHNIKKLKLNNVEIFNIALSDTRGQVTMEIPNYKDSGDNYYEARITTSALKNNKSFTIKTDSLDSICNDKGYKPVFIKIDVEGHEWFVINGAKEVIIKYKPVMIIEINQDINNSDSHTRELLDFLKSIGYNLYINANGKLKIWNGEKMANYYFLNARHLENLQHVIS